MTAQGVEAAVGVEIVLKLGFDHAMALKTKCLYAIGKSGF